MCRVTLPHRAMVLAAALAAALPALAGRAQAPPTAAPETAAAPEELTVETVESRRKQASEADLGDRKEQILQLYDAALKTLSEADEAARQAAFFAARSASADDDLQKVKNDLAAIDEQPVVFDAAPLAALETLLKEKREALDAAKLLRGELETDSRGRPARKTELREDLTQLRPELVKLDKELAATPPPDDPAALALARRSELLARRQLTAKQIDWYEKELVAIDDTSELLAEQQKLVAAQIRQLEEQVPQLIELVGERQAAEDKEKRRQAWQRASQANVSVGNLVRAFEELTLEGESLAGKNTKAQRQLDTHAKAVDDLKQQFTRTQDRVKAGGLTNSIGLLLRKQRVLLPDTYKPRRDVRSRQPEIRQTQVRILELLDRRADLVDQQRLVDAFLAEATIGSELDRSELAAAVGDVLQAEATYLNDTLIPRYDSYFDTLVRLDEAQNGLVRLVNDYRDYIDERSLWIRSAELITWDDAPGLWSGAQWLRDPVEWQETGIFLWRDARANLIRTLAILAAFVLLLRLQRMLRMRLGEIGRATLEDPAGSLWAGLQSTFYTLSIAILWPAVMAAVAAPLLDAPPLAKSVGVGLWAAAAVFFLCEFWRQMCRVAGLAEAHFGWPSPVVEQVRRVLRPVTLLLFPLTFVVAAAESHSGYSGTDPLGRFAFVLLCLILAWAAHRLLRPGGVIFTRLIEQGDRGWLVRLRRFWHLAAVATPLLLAVIAVIGFYYTALRLATKLETTLFFFLAVLLVTQLSRRWLQVSRARLQRRQADRQVAQLLATGLRPPRADADADDSSEPALAVEADESADAETVGEQSLRLLRAVTLVACVIGLYLIWVDVLPALGLFREFTVWETSIGADETREITLADLGIAALILMLTFAATRNLPGMLEIAVLQRLPLDRGSSYAITTVARYAIVVIGLILFAATLGINWAKIQWLAAALTIGLGFGLQEIFANFVSGLILLAERPVRVGDLVTIGNVNGTVTQIRMRATTIKDWNRRELIVPNKELVTGNVINWTLSDSTYRVDLSVGIAYGSDTALARQLLLEVADAHPKVMKTPAPKAIFRGFGESALDFELRVFIPNFDVWPRVVTEINMAIDGQFRTHGIEIAFPQRDIHVRSIDGRLPIVTVPGETVRHDGAERPEEAAAPPPRDE